jgi:thioredoxin
MLYLLPYPARAPPLRQIRSTNEFDRLMNKHATSTGLPVIVDFYSDGCGPCRMIAPVFKKLASEMEGKAVFVKVDTNAMYELSSRYSVRSLPTFKFFLGGKKVHEFSGAGEGQLRQFAQQIIQKAEFENVQFVGVNVRDSAATSAAFEKNFDISWPSIIDASTGSVLLAFTGIVTPQAVPTTIVIGKDGKVTARVLGRIDMSILRTLIKSAAAE